VTFLEGSSPAVWPTAEL